MLSDPLNKTQQTAPSLLRLDGKPVEWAVSSGYVDYADAERAMEARVAAIADGQASEVVWLLEHPPLYTAGVSAKAEDLLMPDRFPVYRTGRGGQFTYHGPGQRVAYVMLDLTQRGRDVRGFVHTMENWIISALERFGVEAGMREGRVGVWVERKGAGWAREDKIAAIGVKVRKWVSFHGISLNVEPDLDHFGGIVPCGITGHGVTSLMNLGIVATMEDADDALKGSFRRHFGEIVEGVPLV